jgi:hypothetical protein
MSCDNETGWPADVGRVRLLGCLVGALLRCPAVGCAGLLEMVSEQELAALVGAGLLEVGAAQEAGGVVLARAFWALVSGALLATQQDLERARQDVPKWDGRWLWLGDEMVLEIVREAENQGPVVDAFEKAGWPDRIANPFPDDGLQCPKERLRQTLKDLNRKQKPVRVHFLVDRGGKWARWRLEREEIR